MHLLQMKLGNTDERNRERLGREEREHNASDICVSKIHGTEMIYKIHVSVNFKMRALLAA